jgi:parallel beta-helix repeat protein
MPDSLGSAGIYGLIGINSIIYNIGRGCIIVGSPGGGVGTGTIIRNNTLRNCLRSGILLSYAHNSTVENNITDTFNIYYNA